MPRWFEPHHESEASCIVFIMKISFHSHANKTDFLMKSFELKPRLHEQFLIWQFLCGNFYLPV